jgi:hypothetical protein
MATMERPASTWLFDQGTLTVHHLGNTVSLGRYATHELAAKAAAAYFAKHGGRAVSKSHRSGRSAGIGLALRNAGERLEPSHN